MISDSQTCKADGSVRAAAHAFAAPDALGMIGRSNRIHRHIAYLGTCAAVHAFIAVHMKTDCRHLIEQSVKCAERTDVFAEGTCDND